MRRLEIKLFLWAASLLVLSACSENHPGFDTIRPGTYEHKLNTRVYGFRRSYLLHIPKGYDHSTALPLVVALHGGFRTAKQMEEESGFSELADQESYIVLYPNGISFFGWLQHWNAEHCCGLAMKEGIDDVGFVSAVIEQTCQRLQVDRSRIYLVGYSNGGMLAHLFAAQRPEIPAAVAAIAATIGSQSSPSAPEVRIPQAKAPVPIIMLHGREDDVVPYEREGFSRGWQHVYVSVKESVSFWIKANQVALLPQKEEMMGGKILKETWAGNHKGGEVVLYTLEGWKHNLPAKTHTRRLAATNSLKEFHASQHIWDFFKKHRR